MKLNQWLHAIRLYRSISAEVAGASSHAFVDRCFWRIWRRGAEADLFNHYVNQLANRERTRLSIVYEMSRSPEHVVAVRSWQHYALLEALHLTRCQMIRHLPPAQTIVDIGGAAPASIQGSLLVMGYRHHFQSLTIVDLPPDKRLYDTYSQADDEHRDGTISTEMGPIRYVHGSMTDLGNIESSSVDLVFSGQSIEHVSREDGLKVFREVYRVLKPNGLFCLDTPNSKLTRIQSPDQFVHPEHQVEYQPTELATLVEQAGYQIVKLQGLCPMPQTVATGIFNEMEAIQNATLSNQPDLCYLFAIQARKMH